MKDLLTNNWKLKLFAILLAFLTWLTVVNINNPEIPGVKTGIPIEVRNADILLEQEVPRTYTIVGGSTATVEYRVRQMSSNKVSAGDFTVYVDFNEWHPSVGTLPLHLEYTGDTSIIDRGSMKLKTEVLKVETEALLTQTFRVRVDVLGEVQDGYTVGEKTSSPNTVTVTAPESVMKKIDHISIAAEVTDAVSEISQEGQLVIYDGNGDVLNQKDNKIEMSSATARVRLEILKVNTIPVVVTNVTGVPAEGYRYTETICSVDSVQVAGSKSAISTLPSIILDDSSIDVTGATGNVVVQFDLKDFLPVNVSIISDESTMVTVTLVVEPLTEKEFTITEENLTFINIDEDRVYELKENQEITFAVVGLKEDLDQLELSMMNFRIDAAQLVRGTMEVPVEVSFRSEEHGEIFEIRDMPTVTVTVSNVE